MAGRNTELRQEGLRSCWNCEAAPLGHYEGRVLGVCRDCRRAGGFGAAAFVAVVGLVTAFVQLAAVALEVWR